MSDPAQPTEGETLFSGKQLKQIVDIVQQLGKVDESQENTASASPPSATDNTPTTATTKKKQSSSSGATSGTSESAHKSFKDIVRTAIFKQKSEGDEQTGNTGINGEWEPTITYEEGELSALEELGLGVAVDITVKHPWVTKSAFQAKSVTSQDLIVINESNKFHKRKEHVQKYSDVQAGLESSFRPDPSTPINVTVAADFHRSNARSKTIDSRTLLTRTVAFRAKVPFSDSDTRERFEEDLHQWLVKKGCVKKCECTHDSHDSALCECPKYDLTTNSHCIDYLKELGGVTHYVSSITLGATSYHVSLNSTVFTSLSSSAGIKTDAFISASTNSKAIKKVFQSNSKEQRIGKIPDDKSNVLQFRTKGEAVVKCSYNSLANLVSNAELRKMLERGIHEYTDSKKNGTRGPYHIATAELMPSKEKSSRTRLYWKIEWENPEVDEKDATTATDYNDFQITYTPDEGAASNFYIKPIIAHPSGDKYFRIATDPEDRRGFDESKPKSGDSVAQAESNDVTVGGVSENVTSITGNESSVDLQSFPAKKGAVPVQRTPDTIREPQRYVNVVNNKRLVVELDVKHNKKDTSAFKIKSVQDGKTQHLSKSQWLPEAIMGSQPHIVCRKGKSLDSKVKKKLSSVYMNTEKKCITLGPHVESYDRYSYFILETGHHS